MRPFPSTVRLVEADLEHGLPALNETFDFILCADILEHLRYPASLLAQLRDVIRPGGRLVASLPNSGNVYFLPNSGNVYFRLNILAGRFPQDDKGLFDRTHLRFFMWRGWIDLLRTSGWEIERMESSAIPVGLIVPRRWEHSGPILFAERLCYFLAKVRKTLFAYQFVVTAHAG
jgi:SAM-dependent methyltransferase